MAIIDDLVQFVTHSDTFMIATVHPIRGADMSHRGGRPGFVRVIDNIKFVWGVRLVFSLFLSSLLGFLSPFTGLRRQRHVPNIRQHVSKSKYWPPVH